MHIVVMSHYLKDRQFIYAELRHNVRHNVNDSLKVSKNTELGSQAQH